MAIEKPLPEPNEDTRPFWEAAREHRLMFPRCTGCGQAFWPPALICPNCHSMDHEWVEASGKGKVYTFTVFHQVYHRAFAGEVPYVVASVELDEGPRLLSNIVDCLPSDVTCDMPVEVVFEDVSEELALPKFRPTP